MYLTSRNWTGPAALALAVVAVSWSAILARACVEAGPLAISFWRLAIATLMIAPWAFRRSASGAPASAPAACTPSVAGAGPRRPAALAALAGIFLALHFACWISSLFLTTVASSVVLVATQPLFSLLLSRLVLGETAGRRATAGVVMAFAGAVLIGAGDFSVSGTALAGDLLALAGALFASAYFVLGRGLRRAWALPRYLTFVNGTAALVLLVGARAAGQSLSGYGPSTWAALGALAAGPHLVGHGLLNAAVRRLPAWLVNMAVLGEPLLASVYAALLFGERPGPALWAGGGLVLAGIALAFLSLERGVD